MLRILHVSDIHFGKPHDHEVSEALMSFAHARAPDLIVLSGDVTQRARVREYQEAREYLRGLPDAPFVVTPGNHDVPVYRVFERLFAPYRNYRAHVGEELDTATRLPGALVVALNSTAPLRTVVHGRLNDRQLDFAAEAFATAGEGEMKILVVHHPLVPPGDARGDPIIPDSAEILLRLHRMDVEMILSGHLHRHYRGSSLDTLPPGMEDRSILIVHAGTTTSTRGRAREYRKNTLNLVEVSESVIEVRPHIYCRVAGAFHLQSAHRFPRLGSVCLEPHADRTEAFVGSENTQGV